MIAFASLTFLVSSCVGPSYSISLSASPDKEAYGIWETVEFSWNVYVNGDEIVVPVDVVIDGTVVASGSTETEYTLEMSKIGVGEHTFGIVAKIDDNITLEATKSFRVYEVTLEVIKPASEEIPIWRNTTDVEWNVSGDASDLVYQIYVDGVLKGSTDGTSFTIHVDSLEIGEHNLEVVARDSEGATVATAESTFSVYTGVLVYSNFSDYDAFFEQDQMIYVLLLDPLSQENVGWELVADFYLDGQKLEGYWNGDYGIWYSPLSFSSPGTHTILVVVRDRDVENLIVGGRKIPVVFAERLDTRSEKPVLRLHVVEYNSGPGVEGAEVFVTNEDGEVVKVGITDEDGYVEMGLDSTGLYNISVGKSGYAPSAVYGLKLGNEVRDYTVIMKKANIEDRNLGVGYFSILPEVEVSFYEDSSKSTPVDLTESTVSKLYVRVEAKGIHPINVIYAAAGKVPGAGFFGRRLYSPATNVAEGDLDLSGTNGETEIHIVVYDYNDSRVDLVFYAHVERPEGEDGYYYTPILFSDFGYSNVDAYTSRGAVEFYSDPVSPKLGRFGLENVNPRPNAAPEDSNMWVEVWFLDYDLSSYYGLISDEFLKPEGYAIYRSEDGKLWKRIGFVPETSDYDVVFRDNDATLRPGKIYYYMIRTVLPGGKEGEARYLGYTVPLGTFNVDLVQPADGATNVSRDPTFVWKPTSDAFSVIPNGVTFEGTYTYTLWIYDFVQSENHLVPLDENNSQLMIYSSEATQMSLKFSSVNWAIISYDFGGIYLYPHSMLEPNKTYEWAVDLAYAQAEFDGGRGTAYSIAINEGYKGVGHWLVNGDVHNTFTTGRE